VALGVSIFAAYAVSLALRVPLEKRFVLKAPILGQPKRQFMLDIALSFIASAIVLGYNFFAYGFPAIKSGGSVVIGFLSVGFFTALDMALARERGIIKESIDSGRTVPSQRLYPMTRKFSLVGLATVLFTTLVFGMVITKDIAWLSQINETQMSLSEAQLAVTYEVLFIMAVMFVLVINLILSYSKNLKLLFLNETRVLNKVTNGDLSQMVPVVTNDEFGLIAGHTNSMIEGLRHRTQLITDLKLAEEVQQNLLPDHAPRTAGLNVAGTSIYCDETGGDYYDYFPLKPDRLLVTVADSSEHGVGAALHMTTTRAFLRFGIRNNDELAPLLKQVNRFLVRDSSDTGRFTTMFLLDIDTARKRLTWVRAGHEPALLYDPEKEHFLELNGKGIALGIDENAHFEINRTDGWTPGSVILVGTDGIREARNSEQAMFGVDRIKTVIRRHSAASAETILNSIIEAVDDFRGQTIQEDDITLVVIKLEERADADISDRA
jgi:sigma-B regulation protein RsbU (phosphoserine phosphatase)